MSHQGVVVLTRARFLEIDLDRLSVLKSKVLGVLESVPGFVSVSLWERHDDPFSFMTVGHFASLEDSLAGWDAIVRSPVMEVINELLSEAPNQLRFKIVDAGGLKLEELRTGTFCSLSTRVAGLGFATDIIKELQGIFTELKMIPGFLGYATGQLTEVKEEVIGLAFWDSKTAFEASLPKKSMYRIDLFTKVL